MNWGVYWSLWDADSGRAIVCNTERLSHILKEAVIFITLGQGEQPHRLLGGMVPHQDRTVWC